MLRHPNESTSALSSALLFSGMTRGPRPAAVGRRSDLPLADRRIRDVPDAAASRLGFLLVALADHLGRQTEQPLAQIGLDGHDYTVLAILDADGPGTQNDIARLMHKAPTVVVAAVDQLERKGFVTRQRDPADRRRSRVSPTPAGLAALSAADALGDRAVAETFDGLGAAELASLHGILRRGLRLDRSVDER